MRQRGNQGEKRDDLQKKGPEPELNPGCRNKDSIRLTMGSSVSLRDTWGQKEKRIEWPTQWIMDHLCYYGIPFSEHAYNFIVVTVTLYGQKSVETWLSPLCYVVGDSQTMGINMELDRGGLPHNRCSMWLRSGLCGALKGTAMLEHQRAFPKLLPSQT